MAGIVCIPLEQAQILKQAIRDGSPIGKIDQLYGMTSKERKAEFNKHLPKEIA